MSFQPSVVRGGTAAEIPVRRVDLKFGDAQSEQDYYAGDPHLTAVLDALSTFFPDGERFFVDSVKHYQGEITDPQLAAAVTAFIGQEAMHARAHELFNDFIASRGLNASREGTDIARFLLRRAKKVFSHRSRLAITCALEHYTAILAEQMLSNDAHRERLRGNARELWLWHALEESEHKSVAFDVYEAVDGSYARRAAVMLPVTAFFLGATVYVYFAMLRDRGVHRDVRGIARAMNYLWIRPGLFRGLIPAYLEYFRPGFHPTDRDTTGLVARWNEALFGAAGSMRARLMGTRVPRSAA